MTKITYTITADIRNYTLEDIARYTKSLLLLSSLKPEELKEVADRIKENRVGGPLESFTILKRKPLDRLIVEATTWK